MDEASERLEWIRPADLPGIEILSGENSSRAWRFFHERYCVSVGTRVGSEWWYRGKVNRLAGHSAMLMEPGELHYNTRVYTPQDFKAIFIPAEIMEGAVAELDLPRLPHFERGQADDKPLVAAFLRLHRSIAHPSTALERQTRLLGCLALTWSRYGEQRPTLERRPQHDAVRRAKAFIDERITTNLTLDQLARAAGVSAFHLVRTFQREVGFPPHAYQLQRRIGEGRKRLAVGVPIATVAADLGFADQSHFGRHFKGIMGVSPARYFKSK